MNTAVCQAVCPALVKRIPTGATTVIEAHAGTGKTFTIEHLVIDLLLRPELTHLSIEQILVVTFTDKATIELKTRIRQKLEHLVSLTTSESPSDDDTTWTIGPEQRVRLQQALFSFDLASIFTIHGFCGRALADQAFDGNRLFRSELEDSALLFQEAFHRTLREIPQLPGHILPLLSRYLSHETPDALEAFLWGLYKDGVRHPPQSLSPTLPYAEAPADLIARISALRQAVPLPIEWKKARPKNPQKKTIDKLNGWYEVICTAVQEAERTGAVDPFFTDHFEQTLAQLRGDMTADGFIPVDPNTRALYDLLFAFPSPAAWLAGQMFPIVQAHLERDKQSNGKHDFDDLLRHTWSALTESAQASGFCRQLRERYRVALIDEFQDTDPTQWSIFRHLFFSSDDRHTLVLIGDPKQAIYGFRGADVETYLKAREEVRQAGGLVLSLDRNFRSTPAVIDAYNRLFADDYFSGGSIRYDDPVRPGKPRRRLVDRHGRVQPPVELLHLPDDAVTVGRRQQLLAQAVSRSIRRILSPSGALYVVDGDNQPVRIRGNRIFILTRKGLESRLIARTLRKDGVPCAFFKEEGLFQSSEAIAVAELFDAILHPEDQTRLNRALLTPFFSCRPENLQAFRESKTGREALARLASWHEQAKHGDVPVLLDRIRTESGIIRRLLLTEDSYRTVANILHLFEILTEQAESGKATIDDLWRDLVHFATLSGEQIGGINNLQRLETDLEAVQILTMHKSKGLEADIVYLFGGFTEFPVSLPLVIREGDARAISGPLTPEDSLALERIRQSENERLLYVALTRARARLCLPAVSPALNSGQGIFGCLQNRLPFLLPIDVESGASEMPIAPEAMISDEADAVPSPRLPVQIPETPIPEDVSRSLARTLAGFRLHSYSSLKQAHTSAEPDDQLLLADPRAPDVAEPLSTGFDDAVPPSPITLPARADVPAEEPHPDLPPQPTIATEPTYRQLPRGTGFGVAVHEVLQQLPIESFRHGSFDDWCRDEVVRELVEQQQKSLDIGADLMPVFYRFLYAAFTASFALPDTGQPVRLMDCSDQVREFDFHFCRPNRNTVQGVCSHNTDLIKGFIDILFRHQDRWYILDWKTDMLGSYAPQDLTHTVAEAYLLQARLYSLAVARLLGINPEKPEDQIRYDQEVGGYIYVFLRGLDTPGQGICTGRVSWEELIDLYNRLMDIETHPIEEAARD